MEIRIFLLSFIGLLSASVAEAQFYKWAHGGGGQLIDGATSVTVDQQGSVFTVGNIGSATGTVVFQDDTLQSAGGQDLFFTKVNSDGEGKVFSLYGGPGDEYAHTVYADSSGNVYLGGGLSGQTQFGPVLSNNISPAFFITGFDTSGNAQWIYTPDSSFSNSQGNVLGLTKKHSNIYACGYFYDSLRVNGTKYIGDTMPTPFVMSISEKQVVNWFLPLSTTDSSRATAVAVDSIGNAYVGGHYRGTMNAGGFNSSSNGLSDLFLCKIDTNGNVQWLDGYGGAGNESVTALKSHGKKLFAGGYFSGAFSLAGNAISAQGTEDAFYAFGDTSGSVKWVTTLGGDNIDRVNTMDYLNGTISVGGYFNDTAVVDGQLYQTNTQTAFILLTDTLQNPIESHVFNDTVSNNQITGLAFYTPDQIAVSGNFTASTELMPAGEITSGGAQDFFVGWFRDCSPAAAPGLTELDNDSVCSGDTVRLMTGFVPGVNYRWLNNDTVMPGENNDTLFATISGNYQVIINDNGCEDTSVVEEVTIYPKPTVTLGVPPTPCQGQDSITLNVGSPAGGIYSGQGVFNGKFGPSIGLGTYNVEYDYTNSFGCKDSAFFNVVVAPIPNVDLPGFQALCSHDTILDLNTGTPSGGTYSGVGVFNNTFNAGVGLGTYTIYYHYTSTTGCSNTDSATIQIDSLPKVELTDINNVCVTAGPHTLQNASPEGGTYSGPAITDDVFDPTQTGPGTFFHSYSYATPSTGCSNTSTATITVVDGPVPDATDSVTVCNGNSVQVSLASDYKSYTWEHGSTDPAPVVEASELSLGGQFFAVTVTDQNDCPGTDSSYVFVEECQNMQVSPNPSYDEINITFNAKEDYTGRLLLYDLSGRKMEDIEISINKGTNNLYLDQFSNYSGVYMLVIEFDEYYLHQQVVLLNRF